MSKGNPEKTVAAILPTPIGAVKPMTLAMYAAPEASDGALRIALRFCAST